MAATKKKAAPKWKLLFPKDVSVWNTIIVRRTDGKVHIGGNWDLCRLMPETPEDAEKEFQRVSEIVEKNKQNPRRNYYHPIVVPSHVEKRINVQEHFTEMRLDHKFSGPIELGKVITSRNSGVTGAWATTQEGLRIGIKLDDILKAIRHSLIADGLVFGTWGFQNIQGDPFLTFENGFSYHK